MNEHVQSVRRHVEELRAKDYNALLGNRTLDFVLMCIPLEPAYQAALQNAPDLIYDLARTNVVITGPTTLMITLRLIAQIWRREHENRNAEVIAERAGRLYDQVALIVDAMLDEKAVDFARFKELREWLRGRGKRVRIAVGRRELPIRHLLPDEPPDLDVELAELGEAYAAWAAARVDMHRRVREGEVVMFDHPASVALHKAFERYDFANQRMEAITHGWPPSKTYRRHNPDAYRM
jgi:hypothetical protein